MWPLGPSTSLHLWHFERETWICTRLKHFPAVERNISKPQEERGQGSSSSPPCSSFLLWATLGSFSVGTLACMNPILNAPKFPQKLCMDFREIIQTCPGRRGLVIVPCFCLVSDTRRIDAVSPIFMYHYLLIFCIYPSSLTWQYYCTFNLLSKCMVFLFLCKL